MPPSRIIDLGEQTDSVLSRSTLSDAQAIAIASNRRIRVEVSWPSPVTGFAWVLRPKGWVGTFRIDERLTVRIAPKTPVARIFELQRIAGGFGQVTVLGLAPTATVQEAMEAVVDALVRSVGERLARGLRKDYVQRRWTGQVPRGRLHLRESALRFASGRACLSWEERSLTTDVEDNRILAFALLQASRLRLEERRLAMEVAHLQRQLAMLTTHEAFEVGRCRGRTYSRADGDYETIHALCALLLAGVGPTAGAGPAHFLHFGFDMARIFERAVAVLLRERLHPDLRVVEKPPLPIGGGFRFVPDLVVENADGTPVAVLDTKYKRTLGETDVQQIVAYAATLGVTRAYLVHPVSVGRGRLSAGRVSVEALTFDLSKSPSIAADDLANAFRSALDVH